MNILAATKQQYKDTKYIVELESSELTALLTLSSYSDIPSVDKDGNKLTRKRDEMQSGDVILSSLITKTEEEIRQLREQKSEMDKAFSTLRGAMTKVQKIINPQ